MYRRAFTLIEILLSIAIVSLLAALILAAFGPARESGRRQSCASNLRQIGTAIAMYIADYDGSDPVIGLRMEHSQLGLPGGTGSLGALIKHYIKNRSVLFCPSYHGAHSLSGLASTYQWPGCMTEEAAPELDLPGIVARRGPDYVLVACDQHNARLDFMEQPRWATKRVQVLRINQQVQSRHVPARAIAAFEW